MRAQFNLLVLLFSICSFYCPVSAQTKLNTQIELNRQTALDALTQLSDSLPSDESDCINLRARMELADLLWARNETRARQLFEEAFKTAFNGETPKQKQCPAQARQVYGVEVLKRIAQRDADWAAQLVDSLPEVSQQSVPPNAAERNVKTRLQQSLNLSPITAGNEDTKSTQVSILGEAAVAPVGQNPADFAPLELLSTPSAREDFPHPNLEVAQTLLSGDFNRAWSLIEKIGDPHTRSLFGAITNFSAVSAAITIGNYDEAMQQAQSLSGPSQRTKAFVTLAQALRGRKGAIKAIEILLIARQSLNAEKESAEKAQAMLTLAEAITEFDPDRGFEFAQAAIETFNLKDNKDASPLGEAGYAEPELAQVLTRLSRYNFARAWNLALSIGNRQMAWFTKLAVCRGLLDEESETEKASQN